jgi:hypothetical protein
MSKVRTMTSSRFYIDDSLAKDCFVDLEKWSSNITTSSLPLY